MRNKQEKHKYFPIELGICQQKSSEFFGWLHDAQVTKLVEGKVETLLTSTIKTHRRRLAGLGVHNEVKP